MADFRETGRDRSYLLEAALHQMPTAAILAEAPSGRLVAANAQAEEILRRPFRLSGRVWTESLAPGIPIDGRDYAPAEWPLNRSLKSGEIVTREEIEILCGDHARRTIEASSSPIRDETGRIVAAVMTFSDITERKQSEESLRESQQRLRVLTDNLPHAMIYRGYLDAHGRLHFTYVSANVEKLHEVPAEAVLADSTILYRQVFPDYLPRLLAAEEEAARAMRTLEFEIPCRLPSGRVRWFEIASTPGRLPDGRIFWEGVEIDITERKRAEEELRRSELRYRSLARTTAQIVWTTDAEGSVVDVLDWTTETDHTLEDVRGWGWVASVHPADRERVLEAWKRAVAAHTPYEIEYRIRDGHGQYILAHVRGVPIFDEQGRVCEWVGTHTDITDRRRAEEALRESEERFRVAFEQSAVGQAHLDLNGRFLRVNDRLCQVLGRSRESLLTRTFQEITHRDDLPANLDNLQRLLRREINHFHMEKRYIRGDGSPIWVNLTLTLVQEGEEPKYFAAFIEDISQRKQAEERLRRTLSRLRLLSEVSSQLLASEKPQEIVESLCRKVIGHVDCQVFLNYLVDEERGRLRLNAWGGISPEVAERIESLDFGVADCGCLARNGRCIAAESLVDSCGPTTELIRNLGLQAYACHPLLNQGRVVGTLGFGSRTRQTFSQDEVELMIVVADQVAIAMQRILLLQSVEQRAAEAQAANVAKGQFLANISHEVRTPMNAILGMTELALEEPLAPVVQEYLQTVRESAQILLAILNEILDFSRIEAGKFSLESAPFELRAMVGDTIRAILVRAQEKGLDVASEMARDVPDRLVGDPLRLRQILINLLGNAIKFTPRGKVSVRVSLESRREDEAVLRFAVSDTGIGIAPEDREKIFAPFAQADASTTRHFGGTGLGLTIAQSLVNQMGGRMWVESERGRGSTFFFTAKLAFQPGAFSETPPGEDKPAAASAASSIESQGPVAQLDAINRPLRILLVEDTPANQKLVQRILSKRGHQVQLADDGREAVEMVRHEDFDVVLMDVQMPVMDGFQATKAIRALSPPEKSHVPIIAMTAHALKGDQDRCLAAGMDAYISKPINSRELIDLVESRARRANAPQSSAAQTGVSM